MVKEIFGWEALGDHHRGEEQEASERASCQSRWEDAEQRRSSGFSDLSLAMGMGYRFVMGVDQPYLSNWGFWASLFPSLHARGKVWKHMEDKKCAAGDDVITWNWECSRILWFVSNLNQPSLCKPFLFFILWPDLFLMLSSSVMFLVLFSVGKQ